ncbi:hypothetical protein NQZ68_036312 [Dissostichus eleginoides]|nr:hypothetical protein NQZ68_036312 [Dissostichus eleginoides]
MEKTFSQRRLEIVEQRPMIGDFKSRWPALFQQSEESTVVLVVAVIGFADIHWTNVTSVHIRSNHHSGPLFLCHFVFLGNLLHLFVDSAPDSMALPEFELLEVSAVTPLLV